MVNLTVQVGPELTALLARLDQAQGQAVGTRAAQQVAPSLWRQITKNSQLLAGSGPFSNGWSAQPSGAPGITVKNTLAVARYIEFPTVPHVIMPNKAKALSWLPGRGAFSAFKVSDATKAAAGRVFFRKVDHPGTAGKGVFDTTMTLDGGSDLCLDALSNAAQGILSGTES